MNPWFIVLTAIILNMNSLGDKSKWMHLWQHTVKADVLCFQEMHLCTSLELAFSLHVQGYDFFFSHGTPALAGVCTAVKHLLGVKVSRLPDDPGHMLSLDLKKDGQSLRVINIYAPNDLVAQKLFFADTSNW